MKRLDLTRVRTCRRCGRGRAELHGEDGAQIDVPLDPLRVRELERLPQAGDLRSLADLVLAQLAAGGAAPREVVLDVVDGHLRALLSFVRDGEPEVVACTPQEGIGLAVRGGLRLYATEEVLAQAAGRPTSRDTGGSNTIH